MSQTETLTLQYPIELGDKTTIKELVIQSRLKGKHMRKLSSDLSEVQQGLIILAGLSGMDEDIIDEMDEVDIKAALAIIKKNRSTTQDP